ncbi:MAG: BspA family leucine-rich repeat surface protein, partial [Bacilli bacterium]
MIKAANSIKGKINTPQNLKGKTNTSIIREYPELENIEIKPTVEEQILKSEKYGFDEVKILGVTAEIDENIKPENIKEGTNILGIDGQYSGIDTSDATATANDISEGKTAYVNNEKITGTSTKIDTDDADATAGDIALGKTAYVKGEKITGSLEVGEENATIKNNSISITSTASLSSFFPLNQMIAKFPDKLEFNNSNLNACFAYCYQITELPYIDMTNIKLINDFCYNCTNLLEVELINANNITMASSAFRNCTKLIKISNLNLSNAKDYCDSIFQNCENLIELNNIVFGSPRNISYAFQGCKSLKNIPEIDFSSLVYMNSAFRECNSLEEININSTAKVSSINYAFYNCYNLKTNLNLDFTSCTQLQYTFYGCGKNTNNQITLSNTNKVYDWRYAFAGSCSKNVSMLD